MLLALAALLCGCSLSRPPLVKQTYLLEAARAPETTAPGVDATLRVGMFAVAPPFAGKQMVYRSGTHRYETDFYNEYFVAPRDMVTQRVFEWMQTARVFRTTLLATAEGPRNALTLSGLVTEMYGDLRDPQRPAAVLAIQFYVTRPARDDDSVLFAQQLRQAVPLEDASAAALARGLSTALSNLLAEYETQLRSTKLVGATN
jgi:cholesterol transport system auxiliary component